MRRPRLALASLSGESDARWAYEGRHEADIAFLGGLSLDTLSRAAARQLVARDRSEFLPPDPLVFADLQLAALAETPIRAGLNVRSATVDPIADAAQVCASHDAVLEINAHCRQEELCRVGCGESLLADTDRLSEYVTAAADAGATVSVKVRADVDGVELPETARAVDAAGADLFHVDAMDSTTAIADVAAAAPDLWLIANNGVRDRSTVEAYLEDGADAVSLGRPSTNSVVRRRVRDAVDEWFAARDGREPEATPNGSQGR